MAYVIIFALVCSLVVALSLVPMLASRLLTPRRRPGRETFFRRHGWIKAADALFTGMVKSYQDLLRWVLEHRLTTAVTAFGLLAASLLLLPLIGTEFLPPSDEGEVRVTGKMEIGTRLELVDRQTRMMESIVQPAVPEAVASVVSVGASGHRAEAASEGEISMSLVPAARRSRSNEEIARDLRRRLADKVPGMEIRVRAPQGQFLLERLLGGDEGLTVEIRGYEFATLDALAGRVAGMMATVPGVTDVETSLEAGIPQHEIHVNRAKVADLGLSVRDVTELLQTAVAGTKAGEYRSGGNSYRILVQLKDAEKRSLDEILDLTLTTASGEKVALRNLVASESSRGPLLINRKDQQRLVTVQANVAGRDLGSVAAEVQEMIGRIPRPDGYDVTVAGTFEEQQKAFRELVVSLVLALMLVYMVLACQYESLRDPLIVMFSVPVAAVGVLVTLFITSTTRIGPISGHLFFATLG
jgi:HAE1 family hydrophobic/amphiphilic exporter-1